MVRRLSVFVGFEDLHKHFGRDFYSADLAHAFFTLFLFFEEFFLAGDIAAIALGEHVLSDRFHRLAGNDLPADRRLNGDLKELSGNGVFQVFGEHSATLIGMILVHDRGERIAHIPVEKDIQLDKFAALIAAELIVEARIALGAGLELVEEVIDDLVKR